MSPQQQAEIAWPKLIEFPAEILKKKKSIFIFQFWLILFPMSHFTITLFDRELAS